MARPVLEKLLKRQDELDVLIHGGDLAYARGRQNEWDAFGRFMMPLTSKTPMQVAVGNQEEEERAKDDPPCDENGDCPKRTPSCVLFIFFVSSTVFCVERPRRVRLKIISNPYHAGFGGYTLRWRNGEGRRLPDGSVTNAFWYSYDLGAVHTVVISSEHDKPHDVAAMAEWLEKDLKVRVTHFGEVITVEFGVSGFSGN
jgi:hypothetical protein